jgi:hypothetical protein
MHRLYARARRALCRDKERSRAPNIQLLDFTFLTHFDEIEENIWRKT